MGDFMNKKKVIWGAATILAVILCILMFRIFSATKVEVVHPAYGPAVQAVYATGTVEPEVMLPIAPRVGARIAALNVDEGAFVHKGDVLARLESQDVRNTVAQLAAQEDFARRDYQRYAALVKGGVIARQNYDRAKANFEASHAATEAARAQIGYLSLVAPSDGRVIKRDGEVGQFLPVNQPLFWLADKAPLRISSEVDEEDISLVKPDQKVLIRADAFPNRVFDGHVRAITLKGDPVARSYRVRIYPDIDTPLKIGMTTETNIITRQKEHALLVPAEAVTDSAVWLIRDGKLVWQKVETGITGRNEIEITKGLSADDVVVRTPDATFKAGRRVQYQLSNWP